MTQPVTGSSKKRKNCCPRTNCCFSPVPKFGRGLEILKLFSARLSSVPYYADALFLQNFAEHDAGGFW